MLDGERGRSSRGFRFFTVFCRYRAGQRTSLDDFFEAPTSQAINSYLVAHYSMQGDLGTIFPSSERLVEILCEYVRRNRAGTAIAHPLPPRALHVDTEDFGDFRFQP